MPLDEKSAKVKRKFNEEYGDRGDRVFYASINAGKVKGIPEAERMAKKRKHARSGKRKIKRRGRR